ncbi:MAG: hypothetical protein HY883_02285 [Deltaproteobacteria bacterium]|nr:hypothetical protein [Deltaproteobacteria bacterium]
MEEPESILEKTLKDILKDISALPERAMQLVLLGRRLKPLAPEDTARILSLLYTKEPGLPGVRRLKGILADPEALKEILGPQGHKLTCLASLEMGLRKVSRLFTDLPPHKKGVYGYDKEEEAKMELLSLGQRRALSKTNVKDTLDRLLSDPDPVVVSNLLNNPRITEREALNIASKRPNSPATLKLLVTHRKWSKSYPVVMAVVLNPYTPPRVSTGLLPLLLSQDLKLAANDKTLHPQVRGAAGELLRERERG